MTVEHVTPGKTLNAGGNGAVPEGNGSAGGENGSAREEMAL